MMLSENELLNGSRPTFTREVHFEPGYNHLDETGPKARGQHGMGIRFVLLGPAGAITLLMNTGWTPPHDDPAITPLSSSGEQPIVHPQRYRSGQLFPTGSHVGFHWRTPHPGAPDGPERCTYLRGDLCHYGAGFIMSDDVVRQLVKHGDAGVWRALLGHYRSTLEGQEHYERMTANA